MGQRAGDGARRAGRIAVSVPPARDAERESRAAKGDAGARLDRRRPGLARQGDEPAADGLEPPARRYVAGGFGKASLIVNDKASAQTNATRERRIAELRDFIA